VARPSEEEGFSAAKALEDHREQQSAGKSGTDGDLRALGGKLGRSAQR
jgi:hypothetical protein